MLNVMFAGALFSSAIFGTCFAALLLVFTEARILPLSIAGTSAVSILVAVCLWRRAVAKIAR